MPGGEQPGGEVGKRRQPKGGQCLGQRIFVRVEKLGPEGKIFTDAEAGLNRIQMAHILAKLGNWCVVVGARDAKVSRS